MESKYPSVRETKQEKISVKRNRMKSRAIKIETARMIYDWMAALSRRAAVYSAIP